jgi:hypothetical protein
MQIINTNYAQYSVSEKFFIHKIVELLEFGKIANSVAKM